MGRREWIALGLTILLLVILLSQTHLQTIAEAFTRLSPVTVCAGFAVWAFTNVLRSRRFRALILSRDVPRLRMFCIVNVQNMLAAVTPARAGDLSVVWLLRQGSRVPGPEGLAGLVMARVLDFVIVSGVGVVALIGVTGGLHGRTGPFLAVAAVIFLAALMLAYRLERITALGARLVRYLIGRTRLRERSLGQRIMEKAGEVHTHVLRTRSRVSTLRLWGITAAIWISTYALSWLWLKGLGLPFSLGEVIFVAAIGGLVASLPIQGLLGFGTTEAGWAIPLMILGRSREEAIAIGFCLHGLAIVYLLILGGTSALYLSLEARAEVPSRAGE